MAEIIQLPVQDYGQPMDAFRQEFDEWKAAKGWITDPRAVPTAEIRKFYAESASYARRSA